MLESALRCVFNATDCNVLIEKLSSTQLEGQRTVPLYTGTWWQILQS